MGSYVRNVHPAQLRNRECNKLEQHCHYILHSKNQIYYRNHILLKDELQANSFQT